MESAAVRSRVRCAEMALLSVAGVKSMMRPTEKTRSIADCKSWSCSPPTRVSSNQRRPGFRPSQLGELPSDSIAKILATPLPALDSVNCL